MAVVGLGSNYATTEADRWPYATEDELAIDYDAHVAEQVLVFDTVLKIDADANELPVELTTDDVVGSFRCGTCEWQ